MALLTTTARGLLVVGVLWAGAAAAACARSTPASQSTPLPAGDCGQLKEWQLPADLYVNAVGDDTRPSDLLATQSRLNSLATVAELHCRVTGRYPASLEEMRSFSGGRRDAPHCAFRADYAVDAWDRPMRFRVVTGIPVLMSDGPDGVPGTTDDVTLPSAQDRLSRPIDVSTCS